MNQETRNVVNAVNMIMLCQSILLNNVDIKCCTTLYATINAVMVKKNHQCNIMLHNEKRATPCPLKDTEIGPHSLAKQ